MLTPSLFRFLFSHLFIPRNSPLRFITPPPVCSLRQLRPRASEIPPKSAQLGNETGSRSSWLSSAPTIMRLQNDDVVAG
jgi:hypothetical protein